jgi:hypothetical protein
MNKSFLVLFFKKEQEKKHFFLKKEAKTFVHFAGRCGAARTLLATQEGRRIS